MAVDLSRAVEAALASIVADPDNVAPGRTVTPLPNDELRAVVYYIAKAILEEVTEHAELSTSTTGTSGVID